MVVVVVVKDKRWIVGHLKASKHCNTRENMSSSISVNVKVEFLGGLDQTFGGVRSTKCQVSSSSAENEVKLMDLIQHLASNLITNEKDLEMFIQDGTVRPGILVLINDTDWELEEKEDYVLEDGDLISFTSTLHGG